MVGLAGLARDRGLTLQIHVAETKAGAYAAYVRYGKSAISKLDELGLLGPRTILAHCVWIDERDMDLIAERGATISHNPVSNLKLGSGIAPLARMLERGCKVALGTDGSASSDNQNLFGVIRQAALLPRVTERSHERWPIAADVLTMATFDGGRASGFDRVGAIAGGELADLVLIDLASTYYQPSNDLLNQLVHADVGASISMVLVNGEVVVKDGRMTRIQEAGLFEEAQEAALRVSDTLTRAPGLAASIVPAMRRALEAAAQTPRMREIAALAPLSPR
jgi:cytosine/adenosine deaminase-related metal-dependent hydrolase